MQLEVEEDFQVKHYTSISVQLFADRAVDAGAPRLWNILPAEVPVSDLSWDFGLGFFFFNCPTTLVFRYPCSLVLL